VQIDLVGTAGRQRGCVTAAPRSEAGAAEKTSLAGGGVAFGLFVHERGGARFREGAIGTRGAHDDQRLRPTDNAGLSLLRHLERWLWRPILSPTLVRRPKSRSHARAGGLFNVPRTVTQGIAVVWGAVRCWGPPHWGKFGTRRSHFRFA